MDLIWFQIASVALVLSYIKASYLTALKHTWVKGDFDISARCWPFQAVDVKETLKGALFSWM